MIRIAKDHVVRDWEVKVPYPRDGGSVEEIPIKVSFRLLPNSEHLAALQNPFAASGGGRSIFDVVADHIVGWEGIGDEDGNPIPWSPEAARRILDFPFMWEAIRDGLVRASRGEGARKNS